MSFLESMQKRYTTKKYNPSKKIDDSKIQELKEILRLTPSSINSQPWKFTFITDVETKGKLSEVSWINTQKVLDCDTLVVFSRIDDLDYLEEQVKRELPKGAVDYFHNKIKTMSDQEIKRWIDKQVYLSVGVMLSACAEMNIDSTPMEGLEPDKYDDILGQKNYHTLVAIAIGYRDEDDANQPSKKPKSRMDLDTVIETI